LVCAALLIGKSSPHKHRIDECWLNYIKRIKDLNAARRIADQLSGWTNPVA
jgi:hypothetical protein